MKSYSFNSRKGERKIKVNINIAVVYALIIMACIWGGIYVNGYMFIYLTATLIVLPIYSIVVGIYMEKNLKFTMAISDKEVTRNSNVGIGLIMNNPTIIAAPFCKINMELGNDLYESNKVLEYKVPVGPKGKTRHELPLMFNKCGRAFVKISSIEVRDIMSLITFVHNINIEENIYVMPQKEEISDSQKGSYTEGLTQNEENNLKGNDFSDVSNIREYVPGDRIKDIHWKVSAKKDELMVKERVRLSENQLTLLVDTSGERGYLDSVIALSYNMIRHSLNEGIPVKLLWWNDKLSELGECEIMNKQEIGKAFREMYDAGISKNIAFALDYIRNTKIKVKNYVLVKLEGQEACVKVIEN